MIECQLQLTPLNLAWKQNRMNYYYNLFLSHWMLFAILTLLHSKWPILTGVLAILGATVLKALHLDYYCQRSGSVCHKNLTLTSFSCCKQSHTMSTLVKLTLKFRTKWSLQGWKFLKQYFRTFLEISIHKWKVNIVQMNDAAGEPTIRHMWPAQFQISQNKCAVLPGSASVA